MRRVRQGTPARLALYCWIGLLSAALAPAEIVAVYLIGGKIPKNLRAHVVELDGVPAVIGEPKSGIHYDRSQHRVIYQGQGRNELFVADPAKPENVPYTVEDGERRARSKKNVLAIDGRDIGRVVVIMADESLAGIAEEYALRRERIDQLRAERDALEPTSKAFAAQHVRLVSAMQRLEGWLQRTGFAKAATDLAKQRGKLEKKVRDDSLRARAQAALSSVHAIDPPEDLLRLAKEHSSGADHFLALESQHLRVYFVDELSVEAMTSAMRFAEEVIEGFRAEFVDAYLAEDYPDRIPDGVFAEWLFVPNVDRRYEAYTRDFFGISWQRHREERLAMGGGRTPGSVSRPYRFYRKNRDLDLEALFCHDLGHALAGLHYGGERGAIHQDWLSEGVAYYLSFEYLARNGVTCKSFDVDRSGYVRRDVKREAGDKTVGVARRDLYNEVALRAGRPIEQLARRDLVVMDDADLAKSWSFFDYLARREGERGQRWLRAAGKYAWDEDTFIANWRRDAARILGVPPGEAFGELDRRWKEFATRDQEIGERRRKRR